MHIINRENGCMLTIIVLSDLFVRELLWPGFLNHFIPSDSSRHAQLESPGFVCRYEILWPFTDFSGPGILHSSSKFPFKIILFYNIYSFDSWMWIIPPCQQNNRTETLCAKLYCSGKMFFRTGMEAFTMIFKLCLSGWERNTFSLN